VPATVPATEEVRPGLWQIGVPFPDNPLGYTLFAKLTLGR